jgi:DNA-binding NarL/FixJ family response regulator
MVSHDAFVRTVRTFLERSAGEWFRLRGEGTAETETRVTRVRGRWSVVDRFSRDGNRYVLLREAKRTLDHLSTRERQIVTAAALGKSNKEIAFELGVAHATVRVLLARAAKKVGATGRRDLLARVRSAQSLPGRINPNPLSSGREPS